MTKFLKAIYVIFVGGENVYREMSTINHMM
jgi:hypothetical protein